MRGERLASAPSIVPSVVSTPARWSSAIASMIPEPQTPVTCVPANPGSSDHASHPDHADARLERLRIDAHALDRTRGRTLAARDLRALERRPGRARGGEESVAVAEHDLGVRPDVDDEVHLVPEVRALGEDDAGRVGADVTRDAGQDVRTGARGAPGARGLAAGSRTASSIASANGAPPSGVGSIPSRRWCMIGLPTSVTSRTSRAVDLRRRSRARR